MAIVFVFGLIGFLSGLAGVAAGNTVFGVCGVVFGACAMILSVLSMAWPPPRRDTTEILTSLRSALPGMVKTAAGPAEDMTLTTPIDTIVDRYGRAWMRNSENTYNLTGPDAALNRNTWTPDMIERRFGPIRIERR